LRGQGRTFSAGGRSGAMPREIITLACMDCKRRNYTSTKNKRTKPERIEIKKFCRFERKHTVHREIK
jgi:large subunit ribosomal protein L33